MSACTSTNSMAANNNNNNNNANTLSIMERRIAGSSLLLLCSVLQSLYYLAFFVLCKWRLWSRHTFFLWLISLSISNCSNLIMYTFGFALTIMKFPNCATEWNIWAGHFYNFFFSVSYAHFPAMAFIRLLAVWKPTRTQEWFSLKRTLIMIASMWIANAVHVVILLQFKENWFYFNPVTVGWAAVNSNEFSKFFTWYWLGYEVVCIGTSLPSYTVCYMKIRVMHRRRTHQFALLQATTTSTSAVTKKTSRNGTAQSLARQAERLRTAEKNLLLISLILSAIMGVDIVLWRTAVLIFNNSKYSALIISMVEAIMYGADAIIIITLSKEVRTKVRKLWMSASYTLTTSL